MTSSRSAAVLHARNDNAAEATSDLDQFDRRSASDGPKVYFRAVVAAHLGQNFRELLPMVDEKTDANSLYDRARIYSIASAAVLERDSVEAGIRASQAAEWLRKAIDRGFPDYPQLQTDSDLDPIRNDPEFLKTLQTLGLFGLDRQYALVWEIRQDFVSREIFGQPPELHLASCRAYAAAGYYPAAISVAPLATGNLATASVWHQLSEIGKDDLARRQANAAVAQAWLDQSYQIWPLLEHSNAPRLRTYLIHHSGIGAQLLDRLDEEQIVSAPRAWILALGRNEPNELHGEWTATPVVEEIDGTNVVRLRSSDKLNRLLDRLKDIYRKDEDRGVHSAAEWLLRRWRLGRELSKIEAGATSPRPRGKGELVQPKKMKVQSKSDEQQPEALIMTSVRQAMREILKDQPMFPDDLRHRISDSLEVELNNDKLVGRIAWLLQAFDGIEFMINEQCPNRGKVGTYGWFARSAGHRMAALTAGEFQMGSPPLEPGREPDEKLHRRLIGRAFAIATKEVTREQWEQFLRANPNVHQNKAKPLSGIGPPAHNRPFGGSLSFFRAVAPPTLIGLTLLHPDDGGGRRPDQKPGASALDSVPAEVTGFEAVQYCNWLSKQEGIPKAQWCYPPIDQIRKGVRLAPDHLARRGYRLPTEAEWEFACRAGASTARFYGHDEEMLKHYARFGTEPGPVGNLQPNDFGLFDVYGNAWEWCYDRYAPYPEAANLAEKKKGVADLTKQFEQSPDDGVLKHRLDEAKDELQKAEAADAGTVFRDDGDTEIISNDQKRVVRGGSAKGPVPSLRSANRSEKLPGESSGTGFRIARTRVDPQGSE